MRKFFNSLCAITLLLAGVTAASAQGYYRGHGYFMNSELVRIQQGLRSGELTQQEASTLQSRIYQLQNYVDNANSDGRLDWRERNYIDREKADISRQIFNKKHNWKNQDNDPNYN